MMLGPMAAMSGRGYADISRREFVATCAAAHSTPSISDDASGRSAARAAPSETAGGRNSSLLTLAEPKPEKSEASSDNEGYLAYPHRYECLFV